ncbi:MAG: site-specific integrase [Gemmataceae bacterium]|nr:site-specific integrase [Gemmataceae bacterium]
MNNSTRRSRPRHPQSAKPYASFPLTAHVTGRWCKKIKGRVIFFGKIVPDDGGKSAQVALDKFLHEKDYLATGRTPPPDPKDSVTLRDLVNSFLTFKRSRTDSGELSTRMFGKWHRTCEHLISHFGKNRAIDDFRQDDFAKYRIVLSRRLGSLELGCEVQRVRSLFKYAFDTELLKSQVRYGPGFSRPTRKTLRIERAKKGPKLFALDDILTLLDVANVPMRAMILLACNAGLGNTDLANMPVDCIDLKTGAVDYARPKTGIDRRFFLWPETLEAIREVLAKRPAPDDPADAGLLFVTQQRKRWCKATFQADDDGEMVINNDNGIAKEFAKLFKKAGLARKKGHSFYTLRHVFATVASGTCDQVAVNHIMGHSPNDMAGFYRERIDDARLQAVAEHVRQWLFGTPTTEGGAV